MVVTSPFLGTKGQRLPWPPRKRGAVPLKLQIRQRCRLLGVPHLACGEVKIMGTQPWLEEPSEAWHAPWDLSGDRGGHPGSQVPFLHESTA